MDFIYVTTNLITGKKYVGFHRGCPNDTYLGSGKALKNSIRKYGAKNFKKEILEECQIHNHLELEEKWIEELDTLYPKGYNISPSGGFSKSGGKHSCITRKKLSESHIGVGKGKKLSIDHKEKIRKSLIGKNKGKKHTEETKKQISIKQSGRILSEETKSRMSISSKNGMTKEIKEKISESCKGRIPWNKGLSGLKYNTK